MTHPSAHISRFVKLGEGITILAGATTDASTVIEDNVCVNTVASVDHDKHLGKNYPIFPNATLPGTVRVSQFASIGSGAVGAPNLAIGKHSCVAAGAVVVKKVPEGVIVAGVPATGIGQTETARMARYFLPASIHSGGFQSPVLYFEERLRQILRPGDRVLDAGCGCGKFFSWNFAREFACQVTGVDIREDALLSSNLDARVCADLNNLPFSNQGFDVVNCRSVAEHLATPETAFREFHRVLKTGGRLAIFTPNLLHYFGAAAFLTPHWFHAWFNSRIRGFADHDVFPTHYRTNTGARLNALLLKAGFRRVEVSLVEGLPSVFAFNSLLYRAGIAYGELVNRFDFLARFRLNIIAVAYKN